MGNKTVFLDRDGVINEEVHYLSSPSQLVLIEGAKEAIQILKDEGYLVLVLTNQSGISRGYFDLIDVFEIHDTLNQMVDNQIDDFFLCPHLPSDHCECRKPNAKLFEIATLNYDVDLTQSYMVGDKLTDILAGRNAGVKTIAVKTGYGELPEIADYHATNLLEAVRKIICSQ